MSNQVNYCTMNQLDHYIGNAPWCFSVDRAKSFPSDQFILQPRYSEIRENYRSASRQRAVRDRSMARYRTNDYHVSEMQLYEIPCSTCRR